MASSDGPNVDKPASTTKSPSSRRDSDTAPLTLVTAWAAVQPLLTALPPLVHSLLLWYALSRNSSVYMWLYELLGAHEEAVAFTLIALLPFAVFIALGLFYGLLDFAGGQDFIERYKVQKNFLPDLDDYIAATWIALRNFVVVTFPYAYLVAVYLMPLRRSRTGPSLPSLTEFMRDMAAFVVVEEVLFYYSHRLLHHPRVYKSVHKFHHTFNAPFAIAAVYAHPVEHFISNIFPLTAGPLLMGSHPMSACIWSCVAVINTMCVHSGYAIPGMPPPHFHDWHHKVWHENYGVVGWLDFMHGTSTRFSKMEFLRVTTGAGGSDDEAEEGDDAAVRGRRSSSSSGAFVGVDESDQVGHAEKARGQAMPSWARGRFDGVSGADRARPHVIARRRVVSSQTAVDLSPPASRTSSSGASRQSS